MNEKTRKKRLDAPLTRADLPEILDEIRQHMRGQNQTIINLITEQNRRFDAIDDQLERIEDRLSNVESRLRNVEDDVTDIKRERKR